MRSDTPCHCKKGVELPPWTYKKGVATPIYPAQSFIRLITGTERLLTLYPVCIINANAANQQMMIGKFNVA